MNEAAPGVFRASLPLDFSPGSINVWFVALTQGWMLVDCGMNTDACFHALDQARSRLGIEWTAIRTLLLTHMHPDHVALAPRVLELSGAKLYMEDGDAARMRAASHPEQLQKQTLKALEAAGSPFTAMTGVSEAFENASRGFPDLAPDYSLAGAERLPYREGAWRVMVTPGHTPGHICLYDEPARLLISGDHILQDKSPNISWLPGADALGDYLDSLALLRKLEIRLVLPSHGEPFADHRQWIDQTIEHHERRNARLLELLAGGAQSAHELAVRLWDRPLTPFHYRFAIFEVLAHLEYLRLRGRVTAGGTQWATSDS